MSDDPLDLDDPAACRERATQLAHTGQSGSSAAGLVLATVYVGDQLARIADLAADACAAEDRADAERRSATPLLPSQRIAASAAALANHADEVAAGLELRDDALPVAIRPVTDAIRELADVIELHAASPEETAHPPF
jgi:hypothetical protein